jgi:lipoyl(octanoyl) transferase
VLSTSVVLLTLGIAVCCSKPKVRVFDLTDRLVPYKDAWEWQTALMNHQIELQSQNSAQTPVGHVIMLQHRSVYTLGTASEKGSGPFSTTTKDGRLLEYDLFETERAGQATYHGPGQVVLYPILDLTQFERDINTYLRGLEEVTIDTLNAYGVEGTRKDGLTGVWVGPSKVAAIGIKLRRWVTMHGIALNVAPDMRYVLPVSHALHRLTSLSLCTPCTRSSRITYFPLPTHQVLR